MKLFECYEEIKNHFSDYTVGFFKPRQNIIVSNEKNNALIFHYKEGITSIELESVNYKDNMYALGNGESFAVAEDRIPDDLKRLKVAIENGNFENIVLKKQCKELEPEIEPSEEIELV